MTPTVQRIAIGNSIHTAEWLVSTHAGQQILASQRSSGARPRCLCVPGGVEMYVGRRGQIFYLSRMPGTGFLHADNCASVEDGALFSGATAYAPGAIVENSDGAFRVAAAPDRRQRLADPVTEVGLDGLLDILIEQADINRLAADTSARSWGPVRERLLRAATWIRLGSVSASELLFLPDRYSRETGELSLNECEAFLKAAAGITLICAPLKELRTTKYGWQVVLRHLPWLRLWASHEAVDEMEARWGIPLVRTPPEYALCLLSVKPGLRDKNYTIINMAVRATDTHYLPCGTTRGAEIAAQLLAEGHSLLRPLRFDCAPAMPLADFALLGSESPEPVFDLSASGNVELDAAKRSMASLLQRNGARVRIFPDTHGDD